MITSQPISAPNNNYQWLPLPSSLPQMMTSSYYVHVCEQARWARSAGNSAIENLCITIIIIYHSQFQLQAVTSGPPSFHAPKAKLDRSQPVLGGYDTPNCSRGVSQGCSQQSLTEVDMWLKWTCNWSGHIDHLKADGVCGKSPQWLHPRHTQPLPAISESMTQQSEN